MTFELTPMSASMILVAAAMFLPTFLVSMYSSTVEEHPYRRDADRIITLGTHIGIGGLVALLLFTASTLLMLTRMSSTALPYSSAKAFGILVLTGIGSALISWASARLFLAAVIVIGPWLARVIDGITGTNDDRPRR